MMSSDKKTDFKPKDPTVRSIFHLACPRCGLDDKIDIKGHMQVRVTAFGGDPDKAEDHGSFGWDDDSDATCQACLYEGTVTDFLIAPDDNTEPMVHEVEFAIQDVEDALLDQYGHIRDEYAKVELEMTGQYVTLRLTEFPDGDNGGVV